LGEHPARRALQNGLPLLQHQHLVGQMQDFLRFVGGHHNRQVAGALQLLNGFSDLPAAQRVQLGCGLVQGQDLGLHGQHRGERGALFLPAGEVAGIVFLQPLQPHQGQRFPGAAQDFFPGDAQIGRPEGQFRLQGRHKQLDLRVLHQHTAALSGDVEWLIPGVQVHHPDIPPPPSAVDMGNDAADQVAEGGFPGPVGPQNDDELPPARRQVQVSQGDHIPFVGERHVLQRDDLMIFQK
jgi:hypothetical protein